MPSAAFRLALFGAFVALAPAVAANVPPAAARAADSLPVSARGAAATVDAFHTALRRGDTKAAASLLADDALIFEGGGVERSKAEYMAHHLPADAEFSKSVPSVMTRRSGGSNGMLAWVASEGRTTGTFRDKPLDRVTAETMLLRRVGRGWKITHIHWSSAAKGQ
jgi:ketosteroid isomerase-like protein